ncbi:hypothetical protein Plhal703r1_c19g0084721 [Plasmopara halstedii]
MDTYMFVLLVLVALLSVVAATNDTLSVQSVPSPALKNSSVTTKAVNGAMPVNVNDENRMSREFWHPREFNPQQTYDEIVKSLKQDELLLLKPELKKLANEMHKHNQRLDPEKNAYLQLTQMVIKSHGEGGLSRMIGVQKLSKHAMTDETTDGLESGLRSYWLGAKYSLADLVDQFIHLHELPLNDVKKAADFLFEKNVYGILTRFASLKQVRNPEQELDFILVDRFGYDNMAAIIDIAKHKESAITTMKQLFKKLDSDKKSLQDVLRLLKLDKDVENEANALATSPQMFFLNSYVKHIARETQTDSETLLIDTLARLYGSLNTARVVQSAINIRPSSHEMLSSRVLIFRHWTSHEDSDSFTTLLRTAEGDNPNVQNFKPDVAAALDEQLLTAYKTNIKRLKKEDAAKKAK